MQKAVIINIVSETLDRGLKPSRWERWRPTIDVCRHADFLVERMILLYRPGQEDLCELLVSDLGLVSPETTVERHLLPGGSPADLGSVYQDLLSFAAAYPFSTEDADYFVHTTTGSQLEQLCLLKLTDSRHLPARLLQTQPVDAQNYGDPGTRNITSLDSANLTQRPTADSQNHADLCEELNGGITVHSGIHQQLITQLSTVCLATEEPIFLTGPMGIGKSELARRIYHAQKKRRKLTAEFREVDCSTMPADRAYRELFGAAGIFAQNQGGLVYLDAVCSLGLASQAMLLRSIEDRTFRAVDEGIQIPFDVRIILGARNDLRDSVRRGEFREDLWLKIASWQFDLTALCDRPEDIAPNIDYALRKHMKEVGRRVEFNTEAREVYEDFARSAAAAWKGNFRDLNASVKRMATFAALGKISREHVRAETKRLQHIWSGPQDTKPLLDMLLDPSLLNELDRFDAVQLNDVLKVCRASRSLSDAGRSLYAESRKKKRRPNDADRLRKYLAKFGIEWSEILHSSGR